MEPKLNVTESTPLHDILDAYPWLPEELIALNAQFKVLRSPLVQALIRRSTVADAARRIGCAPEEVIAQLNALVARREEA